MPQAKRSRNRRDQRRNTTHAGSTKCAPDLEQLIQERREAIHTAAAMGAFPPRARGQTQNSHSRPATILSHRIAYWSRALPGGPPVMPATADELF
ncbi:hypothetical protein NDU88_004024 [Pleurodeles waltl]|uniref:Uncharacterized protein n=1 Tax=Pleurodeles waltl TaxID=8319 RepID=A0AAV7L0P9_PLEWA|nr:hypothetical protein NDU88_004024 [Pleurodeles waltl]